MFPFHTRFLLPHNGVAQYKSLTFTIQIRNKNYILQSYYFMVTSGLRERESKIRVAGEINREFLYQWSKKKQWRCSYRRFGKHRILKLP
jgi:hypothetical protein